MLAKEYSRSSQGIRAGLLEAFQGLQDRTIPPTTTCSFLQNHSLAPFEGVRSFSQGAAKGLVWTFAIFGASLERQGNGVWGTCFPTILGAVPNAQARRSGTYH